jgi:hypothetical protein
MVGISDGALTQEPPSQLNVVYRLTIKKRIADLAGTPFFC